jgi:HSP20 family protein
MNKSFLAFVEELAETRVGAASSCWCPEADVYRTKTGWLVKYDLAGVDPKEIQLVCQGHRLTISGSRRDAIVQQHLCSYSMEISYNRFERTLELPTEIEAATIRTEYRHGMLLVWLESCG